MQLPETFNFQNPDQWPRWKKRFEQYRIASGLSAADHLRQVSTLLYCLGSDTEDVLSFTDISEEARKWYDSVLQKFDEFFQVRKKRHF